MNPEVASPWFPPGWLRSLVAPLYPLDLRTSCEGVTVQGSSHQQAMPIPVLAWEDFKKEIHLPHLGGASE